MSSLLTNSTIQESNTLKVNRETRGNYFIMDSEQVISRPYQEMQTEALDSVKKHNLSERFTAVRNNVCEHNLRTKTTHLNKERTHTMRNLHMDSSNLRYQVKIMDINKRKNDLALQKRIAPAKDFSYDQRQIRNTAKRLGVTSEESFYLDKRLQYPLRGNILRDHNAKPIIKKARRTMMDHSIQKKIDQSEKERALTAQASERATTSQTFSTTVDIQSPEPQTPCPDPLDNRWARRGSKSAPPPLKHSGEPHRSNTRMSAVNDEPDAKLPSLTASLGTSSRHQKSHVKFQVEEPAPFRQSTPTGLHRSKTFHPGMTRQSRTYSGSAWDSDSDDDYSYCEKVDLRALFFGDKSQNGESKSAMSGSATPRPMYTRMSSEIPPLHRNQPPKQMSEEELIRENQEIREKIDKFLDTIDQFDPKEEKREVKEEKKVEKKMEKKEFKNDVRNIVKKAEKIEVKKEEKIEVKKEEKNNVKKDEKKDAKNDEKKDGDKDDNKETEELKKKDRERIEQEKKREMMSRAAFLLSVFTKPLEPRKQWGYQTPRVQSKTREKRHSQSQLSDIDHSKSASANKPQRKNLWELIRVESENSSAPTKKYSANDLLLQQLTGILVQSEKKPPIPIHSASRALRHTPTFKMKRVVEELMKQRTRYEQQEIEKLQQQEMYGEGGPNEAGQEAWADPTRFIQT